MSQTALRRALSSPVAAKLCGGLLWLTLGVGKLVQPADLQQFLVTSLPSRSLAFVATYAIIALEVAVGVGLLLSVRGSVLLTRLTAWTSLGMSVGVLVLVVLWRDARHCGCFGALGPASFGKRLVVLGLIMFFSGAALVERPAPHCEVCEQ